MRQGYKCPLTGRVDERKPGGRRRGAVELRCAHIIRRTVASASSVSELERSRYRFAISSLDILANYTALTYDDIIDGIDNPANCIAMEMNVHRSFREFEISLIPAEKPNVYKIKFFLEDGSDTDLDPDSDEDSDPPGKFYHSGDIIFKNRAKSDIPLPNPAFLRLHAAIAGVLQASGAGEDINNILKDLENDGNGKGPPRCMFSSCFQFLEHMNARESVRAMLGGFDLKCLTRWQSPPR